MDLTDEQLIDIASRPTILLEVDVPHRALESQRALKAHLRKRYGLHWTPDEDAEYPDGLFYGGDLRSLSGYVRDWDGAPIEMEIYREWATVPEETWNTSELKSRGRQRDSFQWPKFVRLVEDAVRIEDPNGRLIYKRGGDFGAKPANVLGVRPRIGRRMRRRRGPGRGWHRQPKRHGRAARKGWARRRRRR